ncbi:MAG: hypothetical protein D4R67_08660 [Bacteroidetes bacterium]|nr:MAG: hypothetical protein D4R67_08660 [Bacteroidota bacterium]
MDVKKINGISRDGSTLAVTTELFQFAWYSIDGNNLVYIADKFYGLKVFHLSEPPEATLVAQSPIKSPIDSILDFRFNRNSKIE